jgi:hexosaminidase
LSEAPFLLPMPRYVQLQPGNFAASSGKLIALEGGAAAALNFTAGRLQAALRKFAGANWEIVAGSSVPPEQLGIVLSVVPGATKQPDGYELTITPTTIHAVAGRPAAVFYAVTTLIQLLQQYGDQLPAVRITDWPDFPNRGLMLDISRDKVPTMATLFHLVDLLASWKINQLQLYTEHTFAYRRHPVVWATASPLTGAEILALDAYCRDRFVELVPNQNCFGHMRRWLDHPEYSHLAEAPQGAQTPWGFYRPGPNSLNPTDPASLELVRTLFDELLPHFTSRQLNVGCDETYDLGQGRSKAAVEQVGPGRVYLDFLIKIYREVKARGRTMQFWGDIIVHHPDLVAELPHDLIALEWGYEASHPFDEHGAIFAQSGVPFYVCPGTSSWNSIAGRTENALANLRIAAENGLRHGAIGYLNTDWGDNGHWQALPTSYLGFAYGAAVSWATEANRDLDMAGALDRFAFQDAAGRMGRLAYDLGNAYREMGIRPHNSSALFWLLRYSAEELKEVEGRIFKGEQLQAGPLHRTSAYLDEVMAALSQSNMKGPDAELVRQEFALAADMLRHACRRGLRMVGDGNAPDSGELAEEADELLGHYRTNWLARNRPGGLEDSVARLEKMRHSY